MVQVEVHRTIYRPVGDVFERLVDIPRYPDWMSKDGLFVSCSKDSEGPVGVGTKYSDKTRLGTLHGEICAFERPNRVVFHYTVRRFGRTVMEGWPGYELERQGDAATNVHHTARGQLYGAFRIFQPLVQRMADAERRRTVNSLKASLESTPD